VTETRLPLPGELQPMMASPGPLPPDDGAWAYEMKWDGIRALAYLVDGGLRLVSRTGRDITHVYPELQGLAGALAGSRPPAAGAPGPQAVLDGEIVAFGTPGQPSFEALQQRMNISTAAQAQLMAAQTPVTYLMFDLLYLDGRPLLDLAYRERRKLLDGLGLHGRHWQTPASFSGEAGADVLRVSGLHGLEGVVAKRLDSRYEPGRRSASWRKIKNVHRQEAVIGGWKPGEGGRAGQIGSLLIGVYGAGGLDYAGHVGTGFNHRSLRALAERLAPLRRVSSPFATPVPPEHARFAVWVQPDVVIEVAFAGWTNAGRMRAAAYKGVRDDKDPAEVVREG
jgi:bifunctional non-homologous end joining protein LigD